MRRMIDLHSRFRAEKAELRRAIRNLEVQKLNATNLLKTELTTSLLQLKDDHARAVDVIKEEVKREGQALYIKERQPSVSQEEIEGLLASYHAKKAEVRAALLKENATYRSEVEQVCNNYRLKREKLEEKAAGERAALEERRAEIYDRFQEEEAELVETYREEKARREAEEGGER